MSLERPLNINIWTFTKVWISAFHYFVKRRMGYWGSHEQPSSCGQPQLSVFTYQCTYAYNVYTYVYDTAIPWYVFTYRYLWVFFSNFCFFRYPYEKAYNRKNIKNYKKKKYIKISMLLNVLSNIQCTCANRQKIFLNLLLYLALLYFSFLYVYTQKIIKYIKIVGIVANKISYICKYSVD